MHARTLRFALELALARFAHAVIPRLPRRVVVLLARATGTLGASIAFQLRKVALANLDIAFGDTMTSSQKRKVVRRAFQSFTLTMLDHFWFARHTEQRIRTWVEFHPDSLNGLSPGAQVCVTAHMGNWEILGMAVAVHREPLVSVAAPLANRKLDRFLNELRHTTGQVILSKHGAVRGLMKTLRNGGKIALVLDQNTKPSAGGIFVNFFGLPVPVSSAVAMLALRTSARVSVGTCLADRSGRYSVPKAVDVPVPTTGDHGPNAIKDLTDRIAVELETLIRNHPEHWLWMYKRWKYLPPDSTTKGYPFYAKRLSEKELAAAKGELTGERPPESPHSSE